MKSYVRITAIALVIAVMLTYLPNFSSKADGNDVTASCTFESNNIHATLQPLLDDTLDKYISLNANDWFSLSLNDEKDVRFLYLQWNIAPKTFMLEQMDAKGNVLASDLDEFSMMQRCEKILLSCNSIKITVKDKCDLSILRVYKELPQTVHNWLPPVEKADIMLIAAHPDDEHIMMGGVLPEYAGEKGLASVVLYMTMQNYTRHIEALNGLYTVGLRTYPVNGRIFDKSPYAYETQFSNWGGFDPALKIITEQLRRFKPLVVVTHAADGEYMHGAHIITSQVTLMAIEAAKDPKCFPESAQKYGTWEVKKLYLHQYPIHKMHLNDEAPLSAFDGKSAFEMAQAGLKCHSSQRAIWMERLKERKFDPGAFGLAYTLVGLDSDDNTDMFEHISESDLAVNYLANPPTPSPSAVPSAAPSESGSPIILGTPTSNPSASPLPGAACNGGNGIAIYLVIGAVILSISTFILGKYLGAKKVGRR
ncbi:MAG: PIG-L family deacetylase [Clostridia bacterium]